MERLTKQHFRLKYKNLRSSLSNEQFDYDCKQINKHINTIATGNVHLFLPIKEKNEVDIWPTIKQLQNTNEVLGTSIFDSATDHVNHVEILKTANFITGDYNIPVPTKFNPISLNVFDTIIIPLLCYDKKGNRIGYGKGIYDRILEKCNVNCKKIGVSLFAAEQQIPSNEHDIKLDFCITPNKVIKF